MKPRNWDYCLLLDVYHKTAPETGINSWNSLITDVDECRQGFCQGGQCTNTPGSFTCHCPVGFDVSSDGRLCIGEWVNNCMAAFIFTWWLSN